MRIALVSPYSWTYPGGVTRHIEALAEQFLAEGHDVRVLAPYDPPGRLSAVLHRGARPQPLEAPDYLVPLGRTVGFKANGAVSNLSITPYGVATLQHELRTGDYDVVHIHEPVAPLTGWVAADSTRLPLVGTFHSYSENRLLQRDRQPDRRPAGAQPPARPDRRLRGGGVDRTALVRRPLPRDPQRRPRRPRRAALARRPPDGDRLRIVFVGQAVERKGLPMLLRAFEALREHIPTRADRDRPHAGRARADDARPARRTRARQGRRRDQAPRARARPTCSAHPSLGGESFGMVLTEAFAGRNAGHRLRHRRLPRRRARRHRRRARAAGRRPGAGRGAPRPVGRARAPRAMARAAAAQDVERFAWPRVAAEVIERLRGRDRDARSRQRRAARRRRASARAPRTSSRTFRPRRLESLEPDLAPRARAPRWHRCAGRRWRPSRSAAPCSAGWRCSRSGSTTSPPR